MADPGDQSRPSFTDFWKKSKEALGVKKLRFVESKPRVAQNAGTSGAGAHEAAPADITPEDKAKIRRAQVRKAQTQHRQRKANYVRQLEMDVARIRDMIEEAERDTKALLDENRAMRAQIQRAMGDKSMPLSLDQGVSLVTEMPPPAQLVNDPRAHLPELGGDVTVTLGFDEVMNAPSFFISSPPSTTTQQSSPKEPSAAPDELPELTPAETHAAINFILALEHVCRGHFHPSLYTPDAPITATTPLLFAGHSSNGHTLMATSLALRNAPPQVFKAASRSSSLFFPTSSSSLQPISSSVSTTTTTTTITDQHSTSTLPTTTPHNSTTETSNNDASLSWKTSALTLRALHGLATSLAPADQVEIAPVQAWFELVRRFGVETVMQQAVLDALKRELVGVVKCPHFGAWMERGAFESVVGRVLGGGGCGVGVSVC